LRASADNFSASAFVDNPDGCRLVSMIRVNPVWRMLSLRQQKAARLQASNRFNAGVARLLRHNINSQRDYRGIKLKGQLFYSTGHLSRRLTILIFCEENPIPESPAIDGWNFSFLPSFTGLNESFSRSEKTRNIFLKTIYNCRKIGYIFLPSERMYYSFDGRKSDFPAVF